MRYARWNGGEYDQAAAQRLREAGYPALLAAVLAARGVSVPEETAPFLEREERLETAVDALRERFGGSSVRRGTVLEKKEREGE